MLLANKEERVVQKEIREQLNAINKLLKSSQSDVSNMAKENLEPDGISDLLRRLLCDMQKVLSRIMKCSHLLPDSDYIYSESVDPTMSISVTDLGYLFILDGLLPHRPRFNVKKRAWESYADVNLIYSGYKKALELFKENNQISMFQEPVLIHVVNYYKDGSIYVTDNDNLDIKTFIDAAVNRELIIDDNPAWCSLFITAKEGSYDHTEITVFPMSKCQFALD